MRTKVIGNTSLNNEDDVYDRQIRLWGFESQRKMSSSTVLFVNISGVSSEILKNLVLAGVHVSICDGRNYPDAMSGTPSSFLPVQERIDSFDTVNGFVTLDNEHAVVSKRQKKITVAKMMQPHVCELNPLLGDCEINEIVPIESIPDNYFKKFDIVVASQIGIDNAVRIANATTAFGGKFFLVHCFGFYGCSIVDLGPKHEYRSELGKNKFSDLKKCRPYLSMEKISELKLDDASDRWFNNKPPKVYAMFRALLNYFHVKKKWPTSMNSDDFITQTKLFLKSSGIDDENFLGADSELKHLATIATLEISPVCTVVGGILGNEIIKAISGKGDPVNNVLLFDGRDGDCRSFTLNKK